MPTRSRLLALVAVLFIAAICVGAQWPQFRGPEGLGTTGSTKIPLTWSEESNVRWKTAIHGRGWSSPIVIGDQVWVSTATPDGRPQTSWLATTNPVMKSS